MKTIYSSMLFIGILTFISCNNMNTTEKEPIVLNEESSEISKVSYSLGISIANNLKQQNFDSITVEALAKGIDDVYNQNELLVNQEEANEIIQNYFKAKAEKKGIKNIEVGKKFLEENLAHQQLANQESGCDKALKKTK